MDERCTAANKTGAPCSARAWKDGRCQWHHPSRQAALAEGRRRGGRAKSNRTRARRELEAAVMGPAELEGVLAVTIRNVVTGRLSPGVGSAVASLARAAVAVREAVELEERLRTLEAAAGLDQRRGA